MKTLVSLQLTKNENTESHDSLLLLNVYLANLHNTFLEHNLKSDKIYCNAKIKNRKHLFFLAFAKTKVGYL